MSDQAPIPENIAPRRRRPVGRVVAAVVLGLVLTLASAWVPAILEAWATRRRGTRVPSVQMYRADTSRESAQEILVFHQPLAGCEDWYAVLRDKNPMGPTEELPTASWPHTLVEPDDPTGGTGVSLFGWPCRCLSYGSRHSFEGVSIHGASSVTVGSVTVQLPLRPVWPGLLVNMTLSMLVAGALVVAPRAARRWWRARNTCCVDCGYSLAGSTRAGCPECGRAIPSSAAGRITQ